MGRQIALNTAIHGYLVKLTDNSPDVRKAASSWVEEYLKGRIVKGRITELEVNNIKNRISIVETLFEAASGAQIVIEAISEDLVAKRQLFKELNAVVDANTILATNSSRFVSSKFIEEVDHPGRLINIHYFNPALVMKLVEVVKGEHCSSETVEIAMEFTKSTGKTPILVRKEIEKFVLNRIITAIAKEAYFLVENGYCSFEEVDLACENGAGHAMGPFKSKDLTGIDLNFKMMQEEYKTTGIKPPGYELFRILYEQGRYGQKTGHGFYDYD